MSVSGFKICENDDYKNYVLSMHMLERSYSEGTAKEQRSYKNAEKRLL